MLEEGSTLKFINFFKQISVPFAVEADFACFTEEMKDTSQPNDGKSYTKQYQKHTPLGFNYYIKCFGENVYFQDSVKYTKQSEDEDIAQIFLKKLEEDLTWIYKNYGKAKMKITPKEQKKFQKATKCWICKEELVKDENHKDYKKKRPVRDHCHFTGKYRDPVHSICNLQYRKPRFTPITFHNLSGYDFPLFIKNLGTGSGKIKCIPHNDEWYISFSQVIEVHNYTDKKTEDM